MGTIEKLGGRVRPQNINHIFYAFGMERKQARFPFRSSLGSAIVRKLRTDGCFAACKVGMQEEALFAALRASS